MLLDRDARTRELLEQFLKRVGGVSCSDAVHGNDNVYVHAPQLVEELLTLHDLYEGDDNE